MAQATAAAIGAVGLLLVMFAAIGAFGASRMLTEIQRAEYSRVASDVRARLDRLAARDQARLSEVAFSDELYAVVRRLKAQPDSAYRPPFAERFARYDGDQFIGVYDQTGRALVSWTTADNLTLDRAVVSNALFRILENREATAGLVRAGDDLFWVAGAPILPSSPTERDSAIQGYVISGRTFRTGTITNPTTDGLSLVLASMTPPNEPFQTKVRSTPSGDSARVEFSLSDVFAAQNTQAIATTSRAVYRKAEGRIQLMLLTALAGIAAMTVSGWWLARRWIVAPVTKLAETLEPASHGQTPPLLAPVSHLPEWSTATSAINRMLSHLRVSQERVDRSLAYVRDGIWDKDLETGEWSFSSRFRALLGYGDAELPASEAALLDLVHPGDRDRVAAALRETAAKATPFTLDVTLMPKGRGAEAFRLDATVHRDVSGVPTRLLGRLSSLAEAHAARDAIAAAEQRERDLALAHGRFLRGLAARAADQPWAPDLAFVAGGIGGTLGACTEDFDLHQLLQDLAGASAGRAEVVIGPGVATRVRGDRAMVIRALGALVTNAANHLENGRITLRAERQPDDPADQIRLVVESPGPVLEPAGRERIARLLTGQLPAPEDEDEGGLGLRVAHQAVRALGGTAGIDTRQGGGSRVWIAVTLPALIEEYADTSTEDFGIVAAAGPWDGDDLWEPKRPSEGHATNDPAARKSSGRFELVADANVQIVLDDDPAPASPRSSVGAEFLSELGAPQGRNSLARQMAALFLTDAPLRLDEIQLAAAHGDRAAVASVAKQLGGMAGLVSAEGLANACRLLETNGASSTPEVILDAIAAIEIELNTASAAMARQVASTSTHSATDQPAIDPSTLDQLKAAFSDDGVGLGSQLVVLFLAEAPLRVGAAEHASRIGDSAGVRATMSDLRGMCSLVGAGPMAALCDEVDRAPDPASRSTALSALRAELNRAQGVLEGLLNTRNSA